MLDKATSTRCQNANALKLLKKIDNKSATIGILGLGYVGLPLARLFCEQGYTTYGFDVDSKKISSLKSGHSYMHHLPDALIQSIMATEKFIPVDDFTQCDKPDFIIICVPTPLTKQRDPDLSYIVAATTSVAKTLRQDQVIVLESSTFPGTTSEVVLPILEQSGKKDNKDFYLVYSPEREDPGNQQFDNAHIPKVVSSTSDDGLILGQSLYDQVLTKTICVSSPRVAEAVKITENLFRAVNIALVNELKMLYDEMDIDVWEVINAAKTKPFGFMPFYPGPGWGGHCIPVDPFYLSWKAHEFGLTTRFVELAGEINNYMPHYVVNKLNEALNKYAHKPLYGSQVLMVGLAYKKNVDDIRESPSLNIYQDLVAQGVHVQSYDPHVEPEVAKMANITCHQLPSLNSDLLKKFDATLICTDHDEIDYLTISKFCPLVVDTRNVFAKHNLSPKYLVKA